MIPSAYIGEYRQFSSKFEHDRSQATGRLSYYQSTYILYDAIATTPRPNENLGAPRLPLFLASESRVCEIGPDVVAIKCSADPVCVFLNPFKIKYPGFVSLLLSKWDLFTSFLPSRLCYHLPYWPKTRVHLPVLQSAVNHTETIGIFFDLLLLLRKETLVTLLTQAL